MAHRESIIIDFGEVKLPFFFGVNSTALYLEINNCDMVQYYDDIMSMIQGTGSPAIIRDLIFVGIVSGCRRDKVDFNKDKLWVGDMMDNIGEAGVKKMIQAIAESLPKSEGNTDEDKKKE